jgi:predicted ATPase
MGRDIPMLVEMVPILGKLFPRNELTHDNTDLAPSEAEERIVRVVRNFLECVALDDRPLVLFLDDLHWSSAAEVSVLTQLISGFREQGSNPAVRNVLLIISYRINELTELTLEKMAESLSQLRELGDSLRTPELQIGPLRLV